MLRITLHQGANWAAELETAWRDLVPEAPTATPFQTWEWQSTWWKHFGGNKKPYVLTFHDGELLVGIMPLMSRHLAWKALRPMGVGASDYLHPLVRAGYETEVGQALSQHLEQRKGLIDLHQLREDQPGHEQLAKNAIEQATCLVMDLPDTYEDFLKMLGKSLRYDVRKLDKKLFNENVAQIEEIEPEEVGRGLDVFFDLHKQRWKKRGLPGAFLGKAVAFQHEWARKAAANGWLWLSVLHFEGKPAGAIYAMKLGDTCYFYQAGFDPAASSISPGTLLVAYTIRRGIENNLKKFDFLRGDEPYKRRWKPQHVFKTYRVLTSPGGLSGDLGLSWNRFAFRVENKIRERLEGRGLF